MFLVQVWNLFIYLKKKCIKQLFGELVCVQLCSKINHQMQNEMN